MEDAKAGEVVAEEVQAVSLNRRGGIMYRSTILKEWNAPVRLNAYEGTGLGYHTGEDWVETDGRKRIGASREARQNMALYCRRIR